MYREVAKLLLYSGLEKNGILLELADIFACWHKGTADAATLTQRIYTQMKRLLDTATLYGFDDNLWHNYLTYVLITNENSFSLTCERVGASDGTVNHFAKNDFKVFKRLFDFDFSAIEQALDIDCFTTISHYHAIPKRERVYNKNVSEKVRALSRAIEQAKDEEEIFALVTAYYKAYGVGMFGINKAFRVETEGGAVRFSPVNNADTIQLSDLIGYEHQKQQLIDNTESFVSGRTCNNVLLYGDAGTGKSSSVKALINAYYDRGLRMIEIYKHQFKELAAVISLIKNRNFRFIIFIDDLSFEEHEVEYKHLKAVIEGGVETKPDNILIYATSNRRHLIKETWNDKNDMEFNGDLHHSDTVEEKLSLSSRFGVQINYSIPSRAEYHAMVIALARRHPEITLTDEELKAKANIWEIRHGGISGRTAQQFINDLAGRS
ncbi:MAG: ATP-binding protein [Oscillospiraceae bacterium]|nr:ATP-binding protein [Oscillospiraceae bacterium]